jgi:hypothetical protein
VASLRDLAKQMTVTATATRPPGAQAAIRFSTARSPALPVNAAARWNSRLVCHPPDADRRNPAARSDSVWRAP